MPILFGVYNHRKAKLFVKRELEELAFFLCYGILIGLSVSFTTIGIIELI